MFKRKRVQASREDRARDQLVVEVLRLNSSAGNKPYIATLMLNNIVERYFKNLGLR